MDSSSNNDSSDLSVTLAVNMCLYAFVIINSGEATKHSHPCNHHSCITSCMTGEACKAIATFNNKN